MKENLSYIYLIEQFTIRDTNGKIVINGEDVIKDRANYMKDKALKFIKAEGISHMVHLSPSILDIVILDYFSDIAKLKDFEIGLENASKNQITAFMGYWWVRRKPIQIVELSDAKRYESLVYVNEKFIATLIAKDFMFDNPESYNDERCKECINHIYYHLKYRVFTAQTLELFLMGINTGIHIGKISK